MGSAPTFKPQRNLAGQALPKWPPHVTHGGVLIRSVWRYQITYIQMGVRLINSGARRVQLSQIAFTRLLWEANRRALTNLVAYSLFPEANKESQPTACSWVFDLLYAKRHTPWLMLLPQSTWISFCSSYVYIPCRNFFDISFNVDMNTLPVSSWRQNSRTTCVNGCLVRQPPAYFYFEENGSQWSIFHFTPTFAASNRHS